jgi:hypothetical protein
MENSNKEDEYNNYIEILPNIKDTKCKIIHYVLYIVLSYSWLIIGLFLWWFYDIYFTLLSIPIVYLISGIVSSKLKLEAIPFSNHEISHSNYEITRWYVAKVIC